MAMRARLDRQASPLRFGVRCGTEDRLNMLGAAFLLSVADKLFSGDVLEEKVFAVFLLEKQIDDFGDRESDYLNDGWIGLLPGPTTMPWCTT